MFSGQLNGIALVLRKTEKKSKTILNHLKHDKNTHTHKTNGTMEPHRATDGHVTGTPGVSIGGVRKHERERERETK